MKKIKGLHNPKTTLRRENALDRLREQMKFEVKTEKKGFKKIPLTPADEKRISKEIAILEQRV